MKLSIRSQLLIWFGLTVFAVAVITTVVAQQITIWSLEKSLDDALQKRANMVAALIASDFTTDEENYRLVLTDLAQQKFSFVPLLLRVTNPNGNVIVQFGDVSDPVKQSLNGLLNAANDQQGQFNDVQIEGIEPLRAYTVSVFHPRTQVALATVQVAETLGQLGQVREQMWKGGLLIAVLASVLTIIVSLLISRRGFSSMDSILRAIEAVDYSHLKADLTRESQPAELEQLSNSLSAMCQRLDVAISERQQALGSISHDLRTPLTALQGQIEVLLLEPQLNAGIRDSLERMLNETLRLTRMVKNILLTTQLESSQYMVNEEVNLRELVEEVIGNMWVLRGGKEFKIITLSNAHIKGDRDLLKQMIMNIVDNAIKFTPAGGKLEFNLTHDNGWSVLSISDTGRGIPAEQLPHVTEAFYKSNSPRRIEGEGARLGLSIVNRIAVLHGGQVTIESKEALGTKVTVRFPDNL